MRMLTFVDLHGDTRKFEKIKKKAEFADIILCAGDLTMFENNLDFFLKELNSLKKQVLIIPGNHESENTLKQLCKKYPYVHYIHKSFFKKGNYLFLGYGGGGFSQVERHFDVVEQKFKSLIKNDTVILLIHAPPHGTKTDLILEEHVGNRTLKNFIVEIKPKLVICGHLHENAGKEDKIGDTKIINPGPEGVVIDV